MYDFNEVYRTGAPWEIGRPQPAIVAVVEAGELKPCRILDAGCGSGELALYLASKKFTVTGIDISDVAIALAREKARARGLEIDFILGNALDIAFEDAFDAVVDTGLYHVIDDRDKPAYLARISRTLRPAGKYFMLCFSDKDTEYGGPKRVTRKEVETNFSGYFDIRYIRDSTFKGRRQDGSRKAYLVFATKGPVA